jgi:hypothetical protein
MSRSGRCLRLALRTEHLGRRTKHTDVRTAIAETCGKAHQTRSASTLSHGRRPSLSIFALDVVVRAKRAEVDRAELRGYLGPPLIRRIEKGTDPPSTAKTGRVVCGACATRTEACLQKNISATTRKRDSCSPKNICWIFLRNEVRSTEYEVLGTGQRERRAGDWARRTRQPRGGLDATSEGLRAAFDGLADFAARPSI